MMRLIISICVVLLSMGAGISMSRAQQFVPPGMFTIGGKPFQCGGIPTYLFPVGGDIATATPGSINLNWPMFSSKPLAVQAYVYAHECAHHLGADENAADCWAVKVGRNQGFLTVASIHQICQAVWFSPGDWTHFPGPARCQNMIACFSSP